ncbi:hypothetical protein LguiA_027061 [Lonicera macranthoides]
MGKGPSALYRTSSRRRTKKPSAEVLVLPAPPGADAAADIANNNSLSAMVAAAAAGTSKVKKKAGGSKLWMRFDQSGQSELTECDKSTIIKRVSIPARDLRIHGPVFSDSSNILAREKAMVVNLEFIKAIVTAEEVLLLDPLRQEVLLFVDQLRQQLPQKGPSKINEDGQLALHDNEGLQAELPFEFQVLEIALEVVCTYLDSRVEDLEREAYPVLDELARNVSTKNLEHVRGLKSNLTRLLARVQKVRDEIEHLLDDNEDMSHLYLTRKRIIQNQQQSEALLAANSITGHAPHLRRLNSNRSGSLVTSNYFNDHDVEDLEMLLEAYFMQLDGTRNKILSTGGESFWWLLIGEWCADGYEWRVVLVDWTKSARVREYIDDTEDYVNIQLDNQRNELIQLQLTLTIASFAIAVETLIAGMFGMNIPCHLYKINGIFEMFVGILTASCILLFLLVLGYARWKKLLGT